MIFFKEHDKRWKLMPVRGDSFGLYFTKPPSLFHRLMQWLVFGFRWEHE